MRAASAVERGGATRASGIIREIVMGERRFGKRIGGVETTQRECEMIVFAEDRNSAPDEACWPVDEQKNTRKGDGTETMNYE